MNLRIVLAIGKNREIGKQNKLLWHLPKDLAHFHDITLGKPVIMGQYTFESLPKPLPQRTNIVLSRDPEYWAKGAVVVNSLERAFELAEKEHPSEAYIIGGGELCKFALPYVTHMSLTFVDAEFPDADAFFPEVDWSEWKEVSREEHKKDENHAYDFAFVELEKKVKGKG